CSESLAIFAVNEGENLLHDVIEDDPASERGLGDGRDTGGLVEGTGLHAKAVRRFALEASSKLLLQAYRLVYWPVVALQGEVGISRRLGKHVAQRTAHLDRLPWRFER